jgi:hypothetical protein
MSRKQWAVLLLGLCACCVTGVEIAENNAAQQQRNAGGGENGALDTDDRDPEYFVREDEVPQGLPPLQEEHAYFAALDLDHGVASPPLSAHHVPCCVPALNRLPPSLSQVAGCSG